MLRDPAPGDWLMPRRTYEGRSYSALDQIDRSNIRDLELVWAWGLEKQAIGVDDQIGPIVHDGIMVSRLTGGVAQALDAATGDLIWEYRHAVMSGLERRSGGDTGGLVLYDDKVYLHPPDGKIVAINARDGSLAWETVLFDPADGYGVSSTGLAVNGKIISGVRCSRFNGTAASSARTMQPTVSYSGRGSRPRCPASPAATPGAISPDLPERRRSVDHWHLRPGTEPDLLGCRPGEALASRDQGDR